MGSSDGPLTLVYEKSDLALAAEARLICDFLEPYGVTLVLQILEGSWGGRLWKLEITIFGTHTL